MLKDMAVAVTMPIFEPSSPTHSKHRSKTIYRRHDYGGMTAESLSPRFCIYCTNELYLYLCNAFDLNYALFNVNI